MKKLSSLQYLKEKAINECNFVKAKDLDKQIKEIKSQTELSSESTSLDFDLEDENLNEHIYELQCKRIHLISERDKNSARQYFQEVALRLAEKQEEEISNLTEKWKSIFAKFNNEMLLQQNSKIRSAHLYSQFDLGDLAIQVLKEKDSNSEDIMKSFCQAFYRQFQAMKKRHEAEFEELRIQQEAYMITIQNDEEQLQITANSDFVGEKTLIQASHFNEALSLTTDDATRQKVIEKYSPHKSPQSATKYYSKSDVSTPRHFKTPK